MHVTALTIDLREMYALLHDYWKICFLVAILIFVYFALFLIGHLKFWKKKGVGIEFAKHFRSHLGPIEGLAVSFLSLIFFS